MPRKSFRPEEIIAKLRKADVLLGQGKKVAEVVKALGVSEVTYYRWRQEYGGMSVSQAKHLKEQERENAQLRRAGGRVVDPDPGPGRSPPDLHRRPAQRDRPQPGLPARSCGNPHALGPTGPVYRTWRGAVRRWKERSCTAFQKFSCLGPAKPDVA
jgi:hypothetical protein